MNSVDILVSLLREESVTALVKRAARKAVRMVFSSNSAFWFVRVITRAPEETAAALPVRVDFSATENVINWIEKYGERWMYSSSEVAVARREGHWYAGILHDGRIIGYIKIGVGRVYIGDYEKTLSLPDDAAFIYDTYVKPEYRGQGIAPYAINETVRFLARKGIRKLGCHIPPWNTASMNAYAKSGFINRKFIRYVKILGVRILTGNPGSVWK